MSPEQPHCLVLPARASPAASASQVARSRLVSSRGSPLPPSSARNPAISAALQGALARSRSSMILV